MVGLHPSVLTLPCLTCTCPLSTTKPQEELDYYMFWVTVYHSKLPYFKEQAKFIHDTIKISVWKVGWQTDSAVQVIYSVAASCRVIYTTYQLASVVAPRMPRLQQLGPELKLKPAERSQLVTAVGTPQTFKVGEHAWQSSVRLSSIGCGWQVFLPVGWDTGVDAVVGRGIVGSAACMCCRPVCIA